MTQEVKFILHNDWQQHDISVEFAIVTVAGDVAADAIGTLLHCLNRLPRTESANEPSGHAY